MDEERRKEIRRLARERVLHESEIRRAEDTRPTPEQLAAAMEEEMRLAAGDQRVRVIGYPDWGTPWASDAAKKITEVSGISWKVDRWDVLKAMRTGGRIGGCHIAHPDKPFRPKRQGNLRPIFSSRDGTTVLKPYECIADAVAELGVWPSALKQALVRGSRCKGTFWRYANVPVEKQPAPSRTLHHPVFSTLDGETPIDEFPSIVAAVDAFGMSRNALEEALKKGTRCRGLHWRYADIPLSRQPKLRRSSNCPVFSTRDGTTPVDRYGNVKKAADALGVHRNKLYYALINNLPYRGLYWRYDRNCVTQTAQPQLCNA